jgi:hypothetical protein
MPILVPSVKISTKKPGDDALFLRKYGRFPTG